MNNYQHNQNIKKNVQILKKKIPKIKKNNKNEFKVK
jgi:hypothetical protein